METDRDKELYKKRKTTVEPVFGILKGVLGFRAPRTPHPSGQSPDMALSLRRLEHPSSPVLCQNLKRNRLLRCERYVTLHRFEMVLNFLKSLVDDLSFCGCIFIRFWVGGEPVGVVLEDKKFMSFLYGFEVESGF